MYDNLVGTVWSNFQQNPALYEHYEKINPGYISFIYHLEHNDTFKQFVKEYESEIEKYAFPVIGVELVVRNKNLTFISLNPVTGQDYLTGQPVLINDGITIDIIVEDASLFISDSENYVYTTIYTEDVVKELETMTKEINFVQHELHEIPLVYMVNGWSPVVSYLRV